MNQSNKEKDYEAALISIINAVNMGSKNVEILSTIAKQVLIVHDVRF